MENAVSHKEVRERLHRRALSQASTVSSVTHSPKTTKSSSTSSSHPRSMTPSNGPHTHKYTHSQYEREGLGLRPQSRLSREPSGESKQPMTPVSSLLQERLQQERRAESERLASQGGTDLSSSTGDIREGEVPNSASKRYKPLLERRPGSSNDDDSSQTSMGAKQIEKAVSTLHKQNFDLKLELFHRREKQTALETRVEELETEHRELTDIQDNLLSELIKRDKAIEEAVNMIVKLEARVDDLVKEKEMVRQMEADESYRHSWSNLSDSLRAETPRPGDHGAVLSLEHKTLERMPSFLSDRSAHTRHLRSVVLQNRSSLRHIRKVSEVSASSADVSEVNRISSPSLSMLSESSFVSVYGSKQGPHGLGVMPLDHVSGVDGTFGTRSPTPTKAAMVKSPPPTRDYTIHGRTLTLPPRPATSLGGHTMPANSMHRREYPLPRGEKPRDKVYPLDDTYRPSTSSRRRSVVTPTPSQAMNSRRERRESLQKVMTGYPTHKELANSHALPPTPDTVSSSVLGKHADHSSSQDSLPRSDDARDPRFQPMPLPQGFEYLRSLAGQEARPSIHVQRAALSAIPRNGSELTTSGFMKADQDRLLSDLGHLARSAAKTATTGRPRSDSFASDSDSDGGADARSETETSDYWLRESDKPDKNKYAVRPGPHRARERLPSPDLFSFPVDAEGWQPDVMFGALQGGGFLGSPIPALRRDPTDELPAPPPNPLAPSATGPAPPSRRSSLHAQVTGHLLSSLTGKTGRGSSRDDGAARPDARGRSNSVDGSGLTAVSGARVDAGPSKRSQYPPIAGLQSRTRGLGLNSLFRRSGPENYYNPPSSSSSAAAAAAESMPPPPVPQQQQQQQQRGSAIPQAHLRYLPQRPSGRSSVPPPATAPWAAAMRSPHMVEDELASATPPPIMRNRPPPLQTEFDVADGVAAEAGACPATPATVVDAATTPVAPPSAGGGGVRKWLGLGRKASPRTRVG
ncbi:hypothetical protein F4825DRAFT_354724 [Nemania diffusa]|nr:hypothetical protein F4825DRAFT_354724 [Nemania diffusa]